MQYISPLYSGFWISSIYTWLRGAWKATICDTQHLSIAVFLHCFDKKHGRAVSGSFISRSERCAIHNAYTLWFLEPFELPITEWRVEDSSRGNNDLRYALPLKSGFGVPSIYTWLRGVWETTICDTHHLSIAVFSDSFDLHIAA